MKINKEQFNKLSQLDRIEFRQKQENIFNGSLLATMIYMSAFVIGFILLMYVGLLNISAETAKTFMINMLPVVNVFKIVFIIAFIFDIAIVITKMKHRKELVKEFFDCKVDIKPKSKK